MEKIPAIMEADVEKKEMHRQGVRLQGQQVLCLSRACMLKTANQRQALRLMIRSASTSEGHFYFQLAKMCEVLGAPSKVTLGGG